MKMGMSSGHFLLGPTAGGEWVQEKESLLRALIKWEGRTVEIINIHALFITIMAQYKQHHSNDFSLLSELGREPRLFFRFPWDNVSEFVAFVFY
jgi:hypothetical protein